MRSQQLHDAKRFIDKRTQFTNPTRRFSESTRFQNARGDFFAARLDVIPLPHAKSVKQVYDAILFYFFNSEICVTDMLGDLVIREEGDTGDESVSQHRLLFSNRHGIDVEINSVVFSEYKQQSQQPSTASGGDDSCEGGEGLLATDFVDQDDLYPYHPSERVRKDVTSIWMVKCCAHRTNKEKTTTTGQREQSDPTALDSGTERAIVLTRWAQSKLHHSEFDIPEEKLVELTEDTNRVNEAVLKATCASLRSHPPTP